MRYQSIHLIAVSYVFNNKGWVFQVGEAGWGKGQVMSDVYFILSYYIYSFMNGPPLFIHSSIDGYFDYFQTQLSYIFAYRFLCGHAFVSLGVGLLIHKISVCLTS